MDGVKFAYTDPISQIRLNASTTQKILNATFSQVSRLDIEDFEQNCEYFEKITHLANANSKKEVLNQLNTKLLDSKTAVENAEIE